MNQIGQVIRPYRASDDGALEAIWTSSWASSGLSGFCNLDPRGLLAELSGALRSGILLVEEIFGQIRGFIAIDSDNQNVTHLFVAPAFRSRGVGGALLNEAKRLLPAGFWLISIAENPKATGFYLDHGMRVEGRECSPGSPATITLSWP